MLQIILLF